jgi:ATP-dependent protease Clp ATPase subunit
MKSLSRLPPPPQLINDYLNGHIIGHYVMKKALSVAIYNHFSAVSFARYMHTLRPEYLGTLLPRKAITSTLSKRKRERELSHCAHYLHAMLK